MDTNHSRSDAFQLTKSICSHIHSGALPYVSQPQCSAHERWIYDYLLPKEETKKTRSKSINSDNDASHRLKHMRHAV